VRQLLDLVVAQLMLEREALQLLSVDESALDSLCEQRLDVRQFKQCVQGMLLFRFASCSRRSAAFLTSPGRSAAPL
jgi:hypothetical protein